MNLVTITDNIASVAATISGIRGANGQEIDTIPSTPWVVVGLPKGLNVVPGNRQVTNMEIPVRLYVERVSDQRRDIRTLYGYVPTFVTTFALNQSLSGAVSECYITAWDTDVFDEIGGSTYVVVDFTLSATVHEAITQSL